VKYHQVIVVEVSGIPDVISAILIHQMFSVFH